MPPKPAEAAKVQPKKETVRINLPPKPTASPTIKLPTLPPTGAGPVPASPAVAVAVASSAPATAARPVATATAAASAPLARAAAPIAAKAAVPASGGVMAARPMPRPAAVSGLDIGLAIAAALMGLAGLSGVIYLMMIFNQAGG
jgi:hypothetical protein